MRGVTRYNIPFYLYSTLSMNGFLALPACLCVCVFISILDIDESLWRYTFKYTFYRSYFIHLISFLAEISFRWKCTLALYVAWLTELNIEQHCFLLCRHYHFPSAHNSSAVVATAATAIIVIVAVFFTTLSLATHIRLNANSFQWFWFMITTMIMIVI